MKQLPRQLTLLNGLSLVIGTIIGSGIFASPGSVLRHAGSGGTALVIWACSGLLALCGALCYAELATFIPSAGGEVAYLHRAYGVVTSFMFTWTNVLVTRPAAFGIICIVFGEYLCRFISPLTGNTEPNTCAHALTTKLAAFICSILVTFFNAYSTTAAATIMGFSTGMKVSALVAITVVGVVYFIAALSNSPINNRDQATISEALSLTNTTANVFDFPQALMSALWAYDGWNGMSYASEEMQNVNDVIRVIRWSVPLVTVLYFTSNAAYIVALPFEVVTSSETVGVDLAGAVLGDFGRIVMMMFVCVSAFGAAMGTVFAGSRLIFSAARDGQLPSFLSDLSESRGTPIKALMMQWVLTCFYLFIGDFDELIGVFGSATWFFYFLTVMGLIVLRRRERDVERPYKAPLIAAFIFCLVAISLVTIEFLARPVDGIIAFGFILMGLPFYWSYQRGGCLCCRRRAGGWSSVVVQEEQERFGEEALEEEAVQHKADGTLKQGRKKRYGAKGSSEAEMKLLTENQDEENGNDAASVPSSILSASTATTATVVEMGMIGREKANLEDNDEEADEESSGIV